MMKKSQSVNIIQHEEKAPIHVSPLLYISHNGAEYTGGPLVTLILGSGKTRVSQGHVTRINNNTSFFSLKNRVSRGTHCMKFV